MNILLQLDPGHALPLPARASYTLKVRAGRVWLTRIGDAGDHFLEPGDEMVLDGNEGVVIECDSAASARLSLASQGSWWRQTRATLWWRLATLALSRLHPPPARWPQELLELYEHALRDIGATPPLCSAARAHHAWQGLCGQHRRLAVGR